MIFGERLVSKLDFKKSKTHWYEIRVLASINTYAIGIDCNKIVHGIVFKYHLAINN